MYRIDSVIQGSTRPSNQCTGFEVSGVYPSGGTQLNRTVLCKLPWDTRLAICPSQNTGVDTPISAMIISSGSSSEPRSTAAATPMAIETTTQMRAAPITSESVAGAAAKISGTTSWPWLEEDTRAP